ncbi:hypothetical protein [Cupriavidus sp. a3]|uniref:hypothetical protein n=1 Tax=Cupriavidus sp. a3 TaxID=3242158 RepID=UPI003D9C533F
MSIDEMKRRFDTQVPRPTQGAADNECSLGSRCISCSGHEAGYYWAVETDISDPNDCTRDSQTIVEDCQEYAEERRESSSKPES